MAARAFYQQPVQGFLEGGDSLLAITALNVGTFLQQTVQFLTQSGDRLVVIAGKEITVEGYVAGLAVGDDLHLRKPQVPLLILTKARLVRQPRALDTI